jgi:hypothetical protein
MITPDTFDSLAECEHYLTTDLNGGYAGHYVCPCSRYGRTTADIAPIAARVSRIIASETGEPWDCGLAEYVMGLAVNDHDDIEHLLASA